MNDKDNRRYEMFGRVLTFGQDHAADFPAGSRASECLAGLAVTLRKLGSAAVTQQGAGSAATKATLLDALRLDLQNIVRTARAIARNEPGFADHFQLPDTPGQTSLLVAVDAVLARLQPAAGDQPAALAAKTALAQRFLAHELPADFVAQLAAARAAVVAAQEALDSEVAASVGGTANIGELIHEGLGWVDTLDAIMHNKYARSPEPLRAWESASHTERAPQRAKAAPAAVPTGATPASH